MEEKVNEILKKFNEMSLKEKAKAVKELRNLGYRNLEFYKEHCNSSFLPLAIASKKAVETMEKELEEKKEVDALKEELKNADKKRKKEIYKRLAELDNEEAKKILIKGLSEDSWDVMETVVYLVAYNRRIENSEIEKLLHSLRWEERRNGIKVLGLRSAELILNYYKKFKADKNVEVRRAYLEALSNLKIDKAILVASYFLNDKNLWVRKEAEKTIKKIKEAKNEKK